MLLVLLSTKQATIVGVAASATAASVSSPAGVTVAGVAAQATAAVPVGPLTPANDLAPSDLLFPGSSRGTVITVREPLSAFAATASSVAPVVRTTMAPLAASAVASRSTVAQLYTIAAASAAAGSVAPPGVVVTALVIPAAFARGETLRLVSPTGNPEPPYINVTIRQFA
jgi:hypothetical protein